MLKADLSPPNDFGIAKKAGNPMLVGMVNAVEQEGPEDPEILVL